MKRLPEIGLKTYYNKKGLQLLLLFAYNDVFIDLVKNELQAKWSQSLRTWYVPFSEENLQKVSVVFDKKATLIEINLHTPKHFRRVKTRLSEKRMLFLKKYTLYLRGKRYSKSTIETYTSFIANFLRYVHNIPLQNITNKEVERFIETDFINKNYSISTQRQFISAIKLLVKFYPHMQIDEINLERPKKEKKLPNVLSKEEVMSIIRCTKNLKHKVVVALIYSSGLRISELINLEVSHIDFKRSQLIIKSGKGRKDRYVILAKSMYPLLQLYLESYQPQKYFVEGANGQYSSSSVRKFLAKSCIAAKVYKNVTPHTLRHSYATHLLENGTGIRYIQELLGHAKPETTMIYTHVAKKDLLAIESPLDSILKTLQSTKTTNKTSLYPDNLNSF